MATVEENLRVVRGRIAEACGRSGRSGDSVSLVAISKTFPAERVRELLACGHALFGENKVQEAVRKIPEVGGGARWHMVGHLQRNKARHAVGAFELIHSVDRVELAVELDRRAKPCNLVQPVLIQVNVSGEESKHGFACKDWNSDDKQRQALESALREIATLPNLEILGLMTMAPFNAPEKELRDIFRNMAQLSARIQEDIPHIPARQLSMGMSNDYAIAIEEGSTMVRIGTAIFGERDLK